MKKILILIALIVISAFFADNIYSNNQAKPHFFSIDLKKNVGSTTWIYIQKGFEEAEAKGVDGVIIEMNTYGGEVSFADSLRTRILNSDIP